MTTLSQRPGLGNQTANIIICGDFNVKRSSENAYQNLITHPNQRVRFIDPINRPGSWSNSSSFADVHTQSTRTSGSCHAGGGSDDRFDFILTNNTVMNDSAQIEYITGSYTTVGQDGNHFNSNINSSPTNTSAPLSVINALYGLSDHLPVALNLRVDLSTVTSLTSKTMVSQPAVVVQNPVKQTLSVQIKDYSGEWPYQITDITGRPFLSGRATGSALETAFEAPAGLYILMITTSEGLIVRKLIKK